MYKVLHITPHCGGGVGDTIFGYLSVNKAFHQEIVILGYALDDVYDRSSKYNVPVHLNKTHRQILTMIKNFDVIIMHVWNHPLLYDFLIRNELPHCRLIMWAHNSGSIPPNIYPRKILLYPDYFVFTTPLSYNVEEVVKLHKKNHLSDIWSTAGIDEFLELEKINRNGIILTYIGTVDYAKLHPKFLNIIKEIYDEVKEIRVVGGDNQEEIKKQAKNMGLSGKMIFTGRVHFEFLKFYLQQTDIFVYPLAPYHYGTCDLILQMAMASGVPIITLNNDMEKHMIINKKSGLIANNIDEFADYIRELIRDEELRRYLGENARKEAKKKFSLEKLEKDWRMMIYKTINTVEKTFKRWDMRRPITPDNIFLESIGKYGIDFEEKIKVLALDPAWQTKTKGSVHNYSSYFPGSKKLKEWSEIFTSLYR
ncbi:MAG: glycosyltransferase family 4 protein [Candidatus Odinarchaeia archaeon]|nr:MAG: glycosyltransferase [Lokiarchaeota virus Fenrir Meg22_1012]URC17219.1 MAG: L-malate glycosyltransferase [Lokiarchaeota virus Fenrir Meg22_1214]